MSLDPAQIAAENRHATSIGVSGTLVINGKNYPARIYAERGFRMSMEGGSLQTMKLSAVVLFSAMPSSVLIDANGQTRSIIVRHLETSTDYRVNTGGVNLSPNRVFWSIRSAQPTATGK